MELWELFRTFFMIGLVSFGGGYAMIPVIEQQVASHGWMTLEDFTDAIAVAGMSPGPIGTNSAIFVGYNVAGTPGAVFSALGMVLPSLFIVILVGLGLSRIDKNKWVQMAFYGLRPIITGLIVYGAIRFAKNNHLIGSFSLDMVIALLIFAGSLLAMMKFRMHPFFVILLSGLTGVAIYS
ncbi:chromate transporter [Paenibacillus koleovorans]|uniref:chromate transporter n=1 Tax=Paenibacillus koleovorans TaxID=121608 RepID=UPI000FD73897|nr:chromate transporter [Paenibacillus koleovorans]